MSIKIQRLLGGAGRKLVSKVFFKDLQSKSLWAAAFRCL